MIHKPRSAVLLAVGRYEDELAGFSDTAGPRAEFVEVARQLGADILSYASAEPRRGTWFKALFGTRKVWGSATNAALRAGAYDRIYATGEDIGFRAAILLKARAWKGRIICLVHNVSETRAKLLRTLGHDIFSHFIVVSEAQAERLRQSGVPDAKIVHRFNWVDDKFFAPAPAEAGESKISFMACGAENRDYATLWRAAQDAPGFTQVFGHGYFGINAARVQDLPSNDKFVLRERVSVEELRQTYANATAVVVPLNDVAYAAGVTGLVEAMAMGRAVIVAGSRGIREYLAAVDADLVVPPGDADAMSRAMTSLAEHPDRCREVGERNRQWILRHCRLEDYVAAVERLLRN